MKRINLIIIPEWGKLDGNKKEYYDSLYEDLTSERINVGFAPNKGVFLKMLRLISRGEDRYLFLIGEEVSQEEKGFVQERLAEIGYGLEWTRSLSEIAAASGLRESLESWLKEIKTSRNKEGNRG